MQLLGKKEIHKSSYCGNLLLLPPGPHIPVLLGPINPQSCWIFRTIFQFVNRLITGMNKLLLSEVRGWMSCHFGKRKLYDRNMTKRAQVWRAIKHSWDKLEWWLSARSYHPAPVFDLTNALVSEGEQFPAATLCGGENETREVEALIAGD